MLIVFFLGFFFLLESRTNNGAKFNFIGIKKIEGVPKFFLKGIQIIFFLSGQDGPGTTLPLTWRCHCLECMLCSDLCKFPIEL